MGYRPKRRTYRLRFEDPEYDGLEVVLRGINMREVLDMERLAAGTTPADSEQLLRTFSSWLVSWNVEEKDGTPTPATFEGVAAQDPQMVNDIIQAWRSAVSGADPKSSTPSTPGDHVLEASLPMEPSSPNLTNSTGLSSFSEPASGSVAYPANY